MPYTRPRIDRFLNLHLHNLKLSCAKCGAGYLISHQVDHIVALCLGGVDHQSNLQMLCYNCHVLKTRDDKATYKKADQLARNMRSYEQQVLDFHSHKMKIHGGLSLRRTWR